MKENKKNKENKNNNNREIINKEKNNKEINNKEKINKSNLDLISESEFIKELKNTIKNNPIIITLNDLLNHNFNSDDSKNLNTTSATTLLGKIENPSVIVDQKNELNKEEFNNKEKKLILKNVEEENSDIFNNSCDEFTSSEKIQKSETYLINPIPFSHYEIKINENKKEINHINEMSRDELMMTRIMYKDNYEKFMKEIKNYSDIIDINEIKKMFKNINNLNDKNIKIIFNSIVDFAKKQLPKEKVDELLDIIYNLISYEIKYKMTDKIINKK